MSYRNRERRQSKRRWKRIRSSVHLKHYSATVRFTEEDVLHPFYRRLLDKAGIAGTRYDGGTYLFEPIIYNDTDTGNGEAL